MPKPGWYNTLVEKVRASMGLQFALALSGWIAVIMLIGTVFVARILTGAQERSLEERGREIGAMLGRASIDRIVANDLDGLNQVVEDVVASRDILAIVFSDAAGRPLTGARASFNAGNEEMRRLLAAELTDDVARLVGVMRTELEPIEVGVDVAQEGVKLGAVRLFFSRAGVRRHAVEVLLLLAGTGAVIVFSLSVLVYQLVRKMIAAPTREAEAVATGVSQGNLTLSVRVSSNDEIGYLGRGLNRMIIGLRGMIGSVRTSSERLQAVAGDVAGASSKIAEASRVQAESVEEAASSVNEMHFTLKEISVAIDDLSGTADQASSAVIETAASVDEVARTMQGLSTAVEETSAAITQMSAAIREIAENVAVMSASADETASSAVEISASVREVEAHAGESAGLAEAVTADAQRLGIPSIEKTLEGMRKIEEETRRSAEVINRLGARAESIGGILTVIEDITDQTSLLALNAAILAAQAGEHGKGFAVVAAQIRDLAHRTAASTKEISELIQTVQQETLQAVESMQKNVALAEEGTRLAGETGGAFRTILGRADQARAMSRGISRAAAEQSRGMKQMTEAVERINQMAHQIARATSEQHGGSEQILGASERMREITRFVRNATAEQVKSGRMITDAVEAMTVKIGLVTRGAAEVRTGSDLIVQAIDRIKAEAQENARLSARLNSSVDMMAEQAAALQKKIERFSTGGADR